MKFIDLINEEYTPLELKRKKNLNAVYDACSRGTVSVRFRSPKTNETRDVVIGYMLGKPKIQINQNNYPDAVIVDNITIYIKDPELYYSATSNYTHQTYLIKQYINSNVRKMLSRHHVYDNVNLYAENAIPDLVFVEPKDPEQINEETNDNFKMSDKEMRKFKIIWDEFSKGMFIKNDIKYRYEIKNEYDVFVMPKSNGEGRGIAVMINGRFDNSISLYRMEENGHQVYLDYELENRLYANTKLRIIDKFANYKIHLRF